ncbi:MAG: hypothetical protein ABSE82_13500 [Nitrososphaerales archaeon]|jgi:hypothetical protein
MNNFDFLVELLLHSFGVKTMFVDHGQKAGVDSVGIGPVGLRIFVVGTTTGIIHDDLQKLFVTVRELKVKLPTLTSRFEVVPLLFTRLPKESIDAADIQYAFERGMIVLSSQDIDQLVLFSRTGRHFADLLDLLNERKREEQHMSPSVYQGFGFIS